VFLNEKAHRGNESAAVVWVLGCDLLNLQEAARVSFSNPRFGHERARFSDQLRSLRER
jgi:hypothetical protein